MLAPETRALLTDSLRPPDGYRVDTAIVTTYSLDLNALLLAPLAFALHDVDMQSVDEVDPIALLESVRRYSDHMTVFCHAGRIAVPAAYRSVMTFVEDTICEVLPRKERAVFHPKVWLLRYVNTSGGQQHRLLCLSRNLTFDRSWDTVLRVDEQEDVTEAPDVRPLTRFLEELPRLSLHGLQPERNERLRDLVRTVRRAHFAPPEGFDTLRFVPSGIGDQQGEGIDLGTGDRLLAISPFLDVATLRTLADIAPQGILLSRAESLERVGTRALGHLTPYTLQRPAEVEGGTDQDEPVTVPFEGGQVPDGLHAKTFVVEEGRRARVFTGSANATAAGLGGRNVEFGVLLEGPKRMCGIANTWDGGAGVTGLSHLVQEYVPSTPEGTGPAPTDATAWAIDEFHGQLASTGLTLVVQQQSDQEFSLTLELDVSGGPGHTRMWPITLPDVIHAQDLSPGTALRWSPMGLRSITPFIAVETTAGTGPSSTTRATVLKADLVGDPSSRRQDALKDVLRSKDDVLRYLAMLLGDPAYDHWLESWSSGGAAGFFGEAARTRDVLLFEPLVRAAARGDDALHRVRALIQDLESMEHEQDLLPEGFREIWQAVYSAMGVER